MQSRTVTPLDSLGSNIPAMATLSSLFLRHTMDATTGGLVQQPSTDLSGCSDWDQPFTEEELESIDAVFQSASSSSSSRIERCGTGESAEDSEVDRAKARRRLPDSLFSFRGQHAFADNSSGECNPTDSFSLSRCPTFRPAKRMRFMNFRGRIVYSRTYSEVEKAVNDLLKLVESKKKDGGCAAVGFDIEWKPTFVKGGKPGKAAVMQMCVDYSHCHVMHIMHSGFPQNLKSLLVDPKSVKVGLGIAGDARKVFADHNVPVEALEDLGFLANQKLGGEPKGWGLTALTERLICMQIWKPSNIRLGNWETIPLSEEQLKYAATDAFASWYLYEVLKGLPDADVSKSEVVDVMASS